MGFLSFITGGSDIAKKAVNSIVATGDALFFTDEEKSLANQKKLDWMLQYMKATQPQNIARRMIAFMVTVLWAFLILATITFRGLGYIDFADYIYKLMLEIVLQPFSIIIGFYFLKHVFSNIGAK